MRMFVLALSLMFTGMIFSPVQSIAGNCEHSWQTDSAGHACGARARDARRSDSYANGN
jgi:hypothetical protein